MSKFAAMLKDSYKEAVDGWIFLVMLILSGVLVVLVGSMSVAPLPAEDAIPKMAGARGGQNPMQMVSPDRGTGSRLIIYTYQVNVADVKTVAAAPKPWESEAQFNLAFTSFGFGPAGVEVDDPKNPKKVKVEGGMFSDAFKEAVRMWASTGGEKPRYTDELAKEFVAGQLKSVTRLNVTKVEKLEGSTFRVTTAGATTPLAWTHRPSLLFGLWEMSFLDLPLGMLIQLVEDTLVNGLGAWVVLLAGVIVTAGFIPNMLRKGAIDLLLTKPMSRPLILLFKYFGGLIFVFLLTAFTVGGVWVAIGLRTGVWAPGLLYCIFGITFYFAILYACSTLFGVLTRNAIVSIVVTIVFWFVVWLIGTIHNTITVLDNLEVQRERPASAVKAEEEKKKDDGKKKEKDAAPNEDDATVRDPDGPPRVPRALVRTFDILNAVTPRTKDLDTLTTELISKDLLSDAEQRQAGLKLKVLNWGEVLGVAGAYIAAFLGLAMLRFVTRSY